MWLIGRKSHIYVLMLNRRDPCWSCTLCSAATCGSTNCDQRCICKCTITAFQLLLHACELLRRTLCPLHLIVQSAVGLPEADCVVSHTVHSGTLSGSNTTSWSNSSRGRRQLLGVWQVAVSNLGVAYSLQVGLRNPTAMPVREPRSLHPVCWKQRNQHQLSLSCPHQRLAQ